MVVEAASQRFRTPVYMSICARFSMLEMLVEDHYVGQNLRPVLYVSIRSCQKPRAWQMGESPANPQPMVGPSPRYLAQVKAFLSYIEDVEVDEEIVEDILTGLEEEFDPPLTSDGEQSGAEADTPRGNVPDEDDDEFAQEGAVRCGIDWLDELI